MRRRIVLGISAGGVAAALAATLIASTGSVAPSAVKGGGSGIVLDAAQETQAAQPAQSTSPSGAPVGRERPAASTAAPSPSVSTALGSITYLTQRYGVSQTEAERRLALQQQSTAVAGLLAQRFPDEFGGLWLDQSAGVLKANMTDPAKLTGVVDPAQVKGVKAIRSLRQLGSAADGIAAAVGPDNIATVIDPVTNQVVVRTGAQLSISDPRLTAAVAATQGAARIDTTTGMQPAQLKCNPNYCSGPPMLGMRLDIPRVDTTVGGCSVGMPLRSAVSGALYVLTAGHCVLGTTHAHRDLTWHQYLGPRYPVSIEDTNALLAENNPSLGHDYAIMPFQDASARARWLGLGEGEAESRTYFTGQGPLRITGFTPLASIQVGWVVCARGSGYTPKPGEPIVDSGAGAGYVPGTHCGEITGKSDTITVRICARRGDSGGPLFTEADGKVLGILSGGDPRSGPCVPGDTETNFYAPISRILDRVNSRTGTDYRFELALSAGLPIPPATEGR